MNIKLVKANEDKIKKLENESALVWVGMSLEKENIDTLAKIMLIEEIVASDKEKIIGYTWEGKTMNELYSLTNDNAYPDDLTFLCFRLDVFSNMDRLIFFRIEYGAKWLDDVVYNNAQRELMQRV